MSKVSSDLIVRQGQELQGISIDEERAAELAVEVDRLNSSVRTSAVDLEFDDQPQDYAARLAAIAAQRKG